MPECSVLHLYHLVTNIILQDPPWYRQLNAWYGVTLTACVAMFVALLEFQDGKPYLWGLFLGLSCVIIVGVFLHVVRVKQEYDERRRQAPSLADSTTNPV